MENGWFWLPTSPHLTGESCCVLPPCIWPGLFIAAVSCVSFLLPSVCLLTIWLDLFMVVVWKFRNLGNHFNASHSYIYIWGTLQFCRVRVNTVQLFKRITKCFLAIRPECVVCKYRLPIMHMQEGWPLKCCLNRQAPIRRLSFS